MEYTKEGPDYFFIEVACEECDEGKYKIYNAYDEAYCEETDCEYCGGTGKILKRVPIPGSEKREKVSN